ncbi:hypothetical protein IZ6_15310 [Terrihabitans soli]|uniref:Uncharacterized protein n=1 Tax=Terrihabitans soli TaxID=708113 RepID=A0A6S6QN28_9HYPH|nr:hypothetical protein [Terrihabitans soli]BCJ90796.1 hypothetical protein IZ6_15310 [Terrihabitans soli]
MKKYLLLPIAAAFMVSPALAQNTNSGNLESQEKVLKGAEESAKPGPAGSGKPMQSDRSSAGESNSGNLKSQDDVLKSAEDSAKPKPITGSGSSVTPSGGDTNSSNLNK